MLESANVLLLPAMTIVLITLAPTAGADVHCPVEATLVAGAGIVGDRHFSHEAEVAGQNLTLVEAEELEAFNLRHGTDFPLTAFRRNLVTRGVRLNDLVGRIFTIGTARLRGVELCEPCAHLAERLAQGTLTAPAIVADLIGQGGLRADILQGGLVRLGDALALKA